MAILYGLVLRNNDGKLVHISWLEEKERSGIICILHNDYKKYRAWENRNRKIEQI